MSHELDKYTDHSMMRIVAVIFIGGLLWGSCHPANPAAGTPVEHKCLTDVGYERC